MTYPHNCLKSLMDTSQKPLKEFLNTVNSENYHEFITDIMNQFMI